MLPVSTSKRVITRFVQIFKHFRKFSNAVKWIFFQGSSPPNFISFCLANQPGDDQQTQTNSAADIPDQHTQTTVSVGTSTNVRGSQLSPPPFPPIRPPRSPSSTDSNVDVTSYADEKLQLLEQAQQQSKGHTEENSERGEQETEMGVTEGPSSRHGYYAVLPY